MDSLVTKKNVLCGSIILVIVLAIIGIVVWAKKENYVTGKRVLESGEIIDELAAPIDILKTRCPDKWYLFDMEKQKGYNWAGKRTQGGRGNWKLIHAYGGLHKHKPLDREKIKEIQRDLIKSGAHLGSYGPDHDGVDGKMGKFTYRALDKFPEIAKTHNYTINRT